MRWDPGLRGRRHRRSSRATPPWSWRHRARLGNQRRSSAPLRRCGSASKPSRSGWAIAKTTSFLTLPTAFDYGLYQLLLAARAAATVALRPPDDLLPLASDVERYETTVAPGTPSILRVLARTWCRRPRTGRVRLLANTGERLNEAVQGRSPRGSRGLRWPSCTASRSASASRSRWFPSRPSLNRRLGSRYVASPFES